MKYDIFYKKALCFLNNQSAVILASILLPICTLFLGDFRYYEETRHGLGFPLNFFYFIGYNMPDNWYQFLLPENIVRIQFRADILALDAIIVYFAINLLRKVFLKRAE